MVMKTVGIAELKATLSERIAEVRRGETITVLDRKTPVATIAPYRATGAPLQIRLAARKTTLGKIPLPRASSVREDILDFLFEDRRAR